MKRFRKLKWYVSQLLPLKYHSVYITNDEKYVSIWSMWFGKVFNHNQWKIN